MNSDIDVLKMTLKSDKFILLSELTAAGAKIENADKPFPCPFHNEATGSAHIHEKNGEWFFKCFGCGVGGDVFSIYAKRNRIENAQAFNEVIARYRKSPPPPRDPTETKKVKSPPKVYATVDELKVVAVRAIAYNKPEAADIRIARVYRYTNPTTKIDDMIVIRVHYAINGVNKKQFMQCSPCPGGYILRKPEGIQPLYNRTGIEKSDWVVYCEGEKATEALMQLGYPACCAPGGANAEIENINWMPLQGKKVYLWPDNDPIDLKKNIRVGIEYMRRVSSHLLASDMPPSIYFLNPDNLGLDDKDDAWDFIDKMKTEPVHKQQEYIHAALTTAKIQGAAEQLWQYFDDVSTGKLRPLSMPWEKLNEMTRALVPGSVTVLCGSAGARKSLFSMHLLMHIFFEEKKKIAAMLLEDSHVFHMLRVLAILCGRSDITRPEWAQHHMDIVRDCMFLHQELISKFGANVIAESMETAAPEAVLNFIRTKAIAGARVILIDPITMMEVGDKQWVADLGFMIKSKAIATEYGVSLILITHPKKGSNSKKSMDDMAGGQAYVRFSHTIMWVEAMPFGENESDEFQPFFGPHVCETYNQLAWVLKARNSYGAGRACGFTFSGDKFAMKEHGMLIEKKEKDDD